MTRHLVFVLLTCISCTSLSGCLLAAAAGAGAGAGYIAAQHSDKHDTVVVHEHEDGVTTTTEHHDD